jgi:hypothetical protein
MPLVDGLYDAEPDLAEFSQGDILRGIAFPTWPTFKTASYQPKWGILRPLRSGELPTQPSMDVLPSRLLGRAESDVPDAFSTFDRSEYVIGRCHLREVIILSRSCFLDNDRRKHIVLAPVTAIADLPEAERGDEKMDGLRREEIPHSFYLPPTTGMRESFANLLMITSIHKSFITGDNVKGQLVARLSSLGMAKLQMVISKHFGMQFGYDHEDICPVDGLYSCSACFHTGREIRRRDHKAGTPFGPCLTCGDQAAFVKVG